jgi:predicted O-linked N-acetylglucosamine transferase (SPINDLY family)
VGAALLRDLELDELIVKDVDSYVALAIRLASEDSFRNRIHAHILSKIKGVPKFLNSRWYGEQAGFMFEHMWRDSGNSR